jgi:hypothetical protein
MGIKLLISLEHSQNAGDRTTMEDFGMATTPSERKSDPDVDLSDFDPSDSNRWEQMGCVLFEPLFDPEDTRPTGSSVNGTTVPRHAIDHNPRRGLLANWRRSEDQEAMDDLDLDEATPSVEPAT